MTEDNSALERLRHDLLTLDFKPLTRPPRSGSQRSNKENMWALRLYTGAIARFFCDILGSYLLLREAGFQAGSFLPARTLFEISASAYYVATKYPEELKRGNDPAWDFLYRVNGGSLYFHHIGQADMGTHQIPRPIAIKDMIGHLENQLGSLGAEKDWARHRYSFISEFTHPNAAALRQYLERDDRLKAFRFLNTAKIESGHLRHFVGGTAASFLPSLRSLLRQCDFKTVLKRFEPLGKRYLDAEAEHSPPLPDV
jgi:hypothetical protein